MANRVKFSDIEVGKTYFVQSFYWHQVLGAAKITEVSRSEFDPDIGTVKAIPDWGDGDWVYLESHWESFWDSMPSESEQRALIRELFGY